jgi:biofilm PGA synthesis N-glycosyltransferase PgaC
MLCVTGAFSLWRRDVLLELGGFAKNFTCEDLEISFRAHEVALRNRHDYRIVSLPDTVGTTETPAAVSSLIAQRARWQRVIMETTWHYRGMLLNPRYRAVGMVGVPVYVISEAVAPLFEVLALAVTAAALGFGVFDWPTYVLLLVAMSFGNAVLTSAAVLLQDRTSHSYSFRHLVVLLLLGPLELLLYRPLLIWARMKGTWGFLRRDRTWDKFERNPRALATTASAEA